jgi:cellobiose-specific phosphotransferase system component IIA
MTGISPATAFVFGIIKLMLEKGVKHPITAAKARNMPPDMFGQVAHLWVTIRAASIAGDAMSAIVGAGSALSDLSNALSAFAEADTAVRERADDVAADEKRREAGDALAKAHAATGPALKALATELPFIDGMFRAVLEDVDEEHIAAWLTENVTPPAKSSAPTPPPGFDPSVN